jgi:hypothetical protein
MIGDHRSSRIFDCVLIFVFQGDIIGEAAARLTKLHTSAQGNSKRPNIIHSSALLS